MAPPNPATMVVGRPLSTRGTSEPSTRFERGIPNRVSSSRRPRRFPRLDGNEQRSIPRSFLVRCSSLSRSGDFAKFRTRENRSPATHGTVPESPEEIGSDFDGKLQFRGEERAANETTGYVVRDERSRSPRRDRSEEIVFRSSADFRPTIGAATNLPLVGDRARLRTATISIFDPAARIVFVAAKEKRFCRLYRERKAEGASRRRIDRSGSRVRACEAGSQRWSGEGSLGEPGRAFVESTLRFSGSRMGIAEANDGIGSLSISDVGG
ncbi:uncharacterized protein LOC143143366 [Ptiloglossa arizonensis]|uniref:uncharacterized protein LOC143143366 n=1 Tax=Ptiloglossa arizonensis TaxID=3350558 RepID=UPI003F9F3415